MLARAFTYVQFPFDVVRPVFEGPSEAWLAGLDGDSGQALLARVGIQVSGLAVYRHVRLGVGESTRLAEDVIAIPIDWHPSGGEALLPELQGEVTVQAVGPRTQVTLNATYKPPLGLLGEAVNRLLLYRLADATVHDFVQRVASNVERILAGRDGRDGAGLG